MLQLLLLALVLQAAAPSVTKTTSGVMNKKDQCVCNMVLPDTIFPAQRLAALENTAHSLNTSVLHEMNKLQEYQDSLTMLKDKLENLTHKVEQIKEPTGEVSPSEISFQLLKVEVKEIELIVQELQSSFNGSNSNVDNLYTEVQNISNTVNELEVFDKNNVLAARREINSLRKRLQECRRNSSYADEGTRSHGICDHKGIARISKPSVVQLNWRGLEHRQGGWGKDASMNSSKKTMYWVAPLETDGRLLDRLHLYNTYNDLQLYRNPIEKRLSFLVKGTDRWNRTNSGQGSGMIVYNNFLYYNCYNSRDICRLNLETNTVERRALTNAVFNNRFSYSGVPFQDMNIVADEKGLWALYATEKDAGNMNIAKLNATTFSIERKWITTQYKPGVTNAFMVCGVLYATRAVNTRKEEIFYMYDTKTGKESRISIMLDKMTETVQSLNYNANDKKMYMYNDGYQVVYDVVFKY